MENFPEWKTNYPLGTVRILRNHFFYLGGGGLKNPPGGLNPSGGLGPPGGFLYF